MEKRVPECRWVQESSAPPLRELSLAQPLPHWSGSAHLCLPPQPLPLKGPSPSPPQGLCTAASAPGSAWYCCLFSHPRRSQLQSHLLILHSRGPLAWETLIRLYRLSIRGHSGGRSFTRGGDLRSRTQDRAWGQRVAGRGQEPELAHLGQTPGQGGGATDCGGRNWLSCYLHLPLEESPQNGDSFLVVSVSPLEQPLGPGPSSPATFVPRPWHSCWVTAAARRWQGCHTAHLQTPFSRSPDGGQSLGRKGCRRPAVPCEWGAAVAGVCGLGTAVVTTWGWAGRGAVCSSNRGMGVPAWDSQPLDFGV